MKYQITNQKDLRAAFWQFCDEFNIDYRGKKTKPDLDLRLAFQDYVASLCNNGHISESLRSRSYL